MAIRNHHPRLTQHILLHQPTTEIIRQRISEAEGSSNTTHTDNDHLLFEVVRVSTFVLHVSGLGSFPLNLFLIGVKLLHDPFASWCLYLQIPNRFHCFLGPSSESVHRQINPRNIILIRVSKIRFPIRYSTALQQIGNKFDFYGSNIGNGRRLSNTSITESRV